MTRLLVSVRNRAEALLAIEAGVDLIDVKEPHRGSLGAADAEAIAAVASAIAGRVPLSVALGELVDLPAASSNAINQTVQYVKIGLANCADVREWPDRWAAALAQLPQPPARVAVVYADRSAARSPTRDEILEVAGRLGCRAALVDTFQKGSADLLDHWSLEEVAQFIEQARSGGMFAVIGGSLTPKTIGQLLPLAPDYLAVRGAACKGSRTAELCPMRLANLVRLVRSAPARQPVSRCDIA